MSKQWILFRINMSGYAPLDFWARKYGYTVFYDASFERYRVFTTQALPSGIRSGLIVLGPSNKPVIVERRHPVSWWSPIA